MAMAVPKATIAVVVTTALVCRVQQASGIIRLLLLQTAAFARPASRGSILRPQATAQARLQLSVLDALMEHILDLVCHSAPPAPRATTVVQWPPRAVGCVPHAPPASLRVARQQWGATLQCVRNVLRAITPPTELLAPRAAPNVLWAIVRRMWALQAAIYQCVASVQQATVELLRELAAAVSAVHRPPSLLSAMETVVLL